MTLSKKPKLSELRKKSDLSKLKEFINTQSGGKSKEKKDYTDNRFWKPTKSKEGIASATIRFLPQANQEDLNWVKTHSHYFQSPTGKWLIEDCPTTFGEACPICESNSELWKLDATDDGPNRKEVRKRKRRTNYICNIYVESDKANPDAEGKVFLYKFGTKIFNKIKNAIQPPEEFEDEIPFDPFDLVEGAAFKIKVKQVDGYDNYDSSEFARNSAFLNCDKDEADADEVLEQVYDLFEFKDPAKFKSYDKLEARLKEVLSGEGKKSTAEEDDLDEVVEQPVKKTVAPKTQKTSAKEDIPFSVDEDEFEDFASLVDDD